MEDVFKLFVYVYFVIFSFYFISLLFVFLLFILGIICKEEVFENVVEKKDLELEKEVFSFF